MSEMESENLIMDEGMKETGCEKERRKDSGFTRPDPQPARFPYQARPDMGGKHVSTTPAHPPGKSP